MEKVDTLVVDKTGTLTEGKPRLASVVAFPVHGGGCPAVCRSLERPASTHWQMRSSKAARARCIACPGFRVPVHDRKGVTVPSTAASFRSATRNLSVRQPRRSGRSTAREGQTVVFVAWMATRGLLGVADPIKLSRPMRCARCAQKACAS